MTTITDEPTKTTPLLNTDRARRLLNEEGLVGVITSTLENSFYFSGVWNFGHELFPYNAESYVVLNADDVGSGTIVTSVGEVDIALAGNDTLKGIVTYGAFVRVAPNGVEFTEDEERIKA